MQMKTHTSESQASLWLQSVCNNHHAAGRAVPGPLPGDQQSPTRATLADPPNCTSRSRAPPTSGLSDQWQASSPASPSGQKAAIGGLRSDSPPHRSAGLGPHPVAPGACAPSLPLPSELGAPPPSPLPSTKTKYLTNGLDKYGFF